MELSDVNNMVLFATNSRNILLIVVVGKSSSLLPHGVILLRSVYVFVYNDIRTYIYVRSYTPRALHRLKNNVFVARFCSSIPVRPYVR